MTFTGTIHSFIYSFWTKLVSFSVLPLEMAWPSLGSPFFPLDPSKTLLKNPASVSRGRGMKGTRKEHDLLPSLRTLTARFGCTGGEKSDVVWAPGILENLVEIRVIDEGWRIHKDLEYSLNSILIFYIGGFYIEFS